MKYKTILPLILIVLTLALYRQPVVGLGNDGAAIQQTTDPYALIDAINVLRAQNGLAPYSVNATLMSIAQSHAGFMAANGVSHYGVGGSRPFERALAAGYPLAGDLTQGGLFSENITAGINKSVDDAVTEWQGDAPHLHTMLSSSLTEIGVGMVDIDGYIYYVIDCGRPTTSGTPQEIPTGMAEVIVNLPLAPVVVNTLVPNTPDATGKVFHTVAAGETLWLIGTSYGVTAQQIREANPNVYGDEIYIGQKLFLPGAKTAIPIIPTATDNGDGKVSTMTPTPTSYTLPPTETPVDVTQTPEKGYIIGEENSNSTSGLIGLLIIVFFGVFLAILLLMLTKRSSNDL